MPLNLSIDQKVTVELAITDRNGNPATVDGTPEWDATPADLVTIEPAADGRSAVITSGDISGDAVLITVRTDADLGDGVRELVGTLEINLTGGEAQFISLTAGEPQPK
jgi:hypothetical protein